MKLFTICAIILTFVGLFLIYIVFEDEATNIARISSEAIRGD